MATKKVKIVVFIPKKQAEKLRQALGKLGAGKIGHYRYCSFSVIGIGRFLPIQGANPHLGQINRLTKVVEERIETVCEQKDLSKVIKAIKKIHPYEEPVIDVYPLL